MCSDRAALRILHRLISQSTGLKSPWPDGQIAPYDVTALLTIDFLFGEFWVSLCEGKGFNQVASNTLTSTTFTTTYTVVLKHVSTLSGYPISLLNITLLDF